MKVYCVDDIQPLTDWADRMLTNYDPLKRAEVFMQNQKQFKEFLDKKARKKKGTK